MKYTIIHVNDRSIENIKLNIDILGSEEYLSDIEFFNGNIGNAKDTINHRGISLESWSPYDGRTFPPLPGELGIWESTIRTLEYIVVNDIDQLLVLEDDVILAADAKKILDTLMEELPANFDFLSLYSFTDHNFKTPETDIGLKHIHKSYNQPSGAQAIIYSLSGAKKILKLIKRKGIEYTSDCFIFEQSRIGAISGYSIIPEVVSFLTHDYKKITSLIDPENIRLVEM